MNIRPCPIDWEKTRQKLLNYTPNSVLISAHRGKFGSSVIENTLLAFNVAIGQGADMIEIDVMPTKDRKVVCWHDDSIKRMTGVDGLLEDFTLEEIKKIELLTSFAEKNSIYIDDFDSVAKALKGKCILVIDKAWACWNEVYEILKKYDMVEQTVFKFYMKDKKIIHTLKEYKGIMLIPMSYGVEEINEILELQKDCSVVGVEILPESKESSFFSKEYTDLLHKSNLLVWCNALSYSNELVFGAGFDDNLSLQRGGDFGWGELISRGVNIIQTDWVYELRAYLEEKRLRN